MTDDVFAKRAKTLEDAFFAKRDQELLERLRNEDTGKAVKEQLASVSGINDDAVLNHLVAHGVSPAAFAAVSLVPLVLVAWADDFVQVPERKEILNMASKEGIREGDPAYKLLESWMHEKPDDGLLADWKAYIDALKRTFAPPSMEELRDRVISRAQRVARAAGGFYGVTSISDTEKTILAEMDAAFR